MACLPVYHRHMKTYLVGGAVRDRLLGMPVVDQDWVVVGATPDELTSVGYKSIGNDFPVFLHPDTHEEYALARTERKSAPGYRGFEFATDTTVTLEEDLQRRDLTINAIAEDADGNLIDPFNGRDDLQNRLLRHVSPAFVEDPVRVLRVARFMARLQPFGFSVAPETTKLIQQMADSGELESLVAERVWQELEAAMASKVPRAFIETLRDSGALQHILPEIDNLFGVPQTARWHPEIDTGIHTLMVLDKAAEFSSQAEVRFAALCHDLGKATTAVNDLPSHPGHEERGAILCEALCDRLRSPKRFRHLAVLTARYHLKCHRAIELKPSSLLRLFQALDISRRAERFEQFLIVCEADARGRLGKEQTAQPQIEYLRKLASVVRKVDTGAVAKTAPSPAQIPEFIRSAQLSAIAAYVRDFRKTYSS